VGGSGGIVGWGDISNIPTFAAVAFSGDYGNLSNIPATFEPKAHTHTIANITDLQTNLDNRYTMSEVDSLLNGKQASGSYAVTGHTHSGEDITSGTISKERLPVIPTNSPPVILSSPLTGITTSQEADVNLGTIVIANDGQRYLYTGTGLKNDPANYILLSDTNITWSEIYDKPISFNPTTHSHATSDVTGLSEAIANYVSANSPVLTVANNSGLSKTLLENVNQIQIATTYNTTMADGIVSAAVGGASPKTAQTWKTMNIVQVLDEILFPTIAPTVLTAKAASLALTGSTGTLEVGLSYSRTLTATFNRGQIKNGDGTSGPLLVGAATNYTFTGTNIVSTSQTGNTLSINVAIVDGTNQWSVSVTHGVGTGLYYDNKGVSSSILDSSRAAGSSSGNTNAITGVYPYYYFKSSSQLTADQFVAAIQDGNATPVVASSTGNLTIPYALSEQYIYVAYPTSTPAKTNYQTSLSDLGGITLVFNPVETKTITRKVGYSSSGTTIWSRQYHVHVGKNKTTNPNLNIILS